MRNFERFEGDFSAASAVRQAAAYMADGRAVAIDNDTVFAIWGDGANPQFANNVDAAKGREPGRAYGLTLEAKDFLSLVDLDRVLPDARPLLENPEAFVKRLGAMAFVRLPVHPQAIEDYGLPASVLSGTKAEPIAQSWSYEGKDNIERLLNQAKLAVPAVTSLNISGKPEITNLEDARHFAKDHDLPMLSDTHARRKVTGSYPIISITNEGMSIIRARQTGIGTAWLTRLLVNIPLQSIESGNVQPGIDPYELHNLSGPELRQASLEYLGWTD